MQINGVPGEGSLIVALEDVLLNQQSTRMCSSALRESKERHFNSLIQHRLAELEGNFYYQEFDCFFLFILNHLHGIFSHGFNVFA